MRPIAAHQPYLKPDTHQKRRYSHAEDLPQTSAMLIVVFDPSGTLRPGQARIETAEFRHAPATAQTNYAGCVFFKFGVGFLTTGEIISSKKTELQCFYGGIGCRMEIGGKKS